jgi:hypothetical protein
MVTCDDCPNLTPQNLTPPSPIQDTKLKQTKMEISNPRRILAVALSDSAQHLSNVIKGMRHHQNSSYHLILSSVMTSLHLTFTSLN